MFKGCTNLTGCNGTKIETTTDITFARVDNAHTIVDSAENKPAGLFTAKIPKVVYENNGSSLQVYFDDEDHSQEVQHPSTVYAAPLTNIGSVP